MCSNYFALRPRHCLRASRSRPLEAKTLLEVSGPRPRPGVLGTRVGDLEVEKTTYDKVENEDQRWRRRGTDWC
ncbi:hypothetical protein TIFTF001_005448 [Ficus carica]|uniref:Uncharacterized protein n=1 Tax=Ficus carica TaxID=3494 RepID=A0AA88A7U4_FICCA|nr:hypothetical protein TIFTF001_005448 [Ficus carica]